MTDQPTGLELAKAARGYRMVCTCDDFAPNVEHINGPIILQSIRSGNTYQYPGKKFIYCPWCGSKLTEEAL